MKKKKKVVRILITSEFFWVIIEELWVIYSSANQD